MRHPLTRLCENVARAFQPEGLSDSSRWSKRSADHRTTNETIFHPEKGWQKTVEPLQGSGELPASFRWSALRFDHRLLSDSLSGWDPPAYGGGSDKPFLVLAEQSSIEMLSDNLNSLDRIDTIN